MKSAIFLSLFILLNSFAPATGSTYRTALTGCFFERNDNDEYDFKNEKIINSLGEYNISITDNYILFDSVYGNIDAPLRYKRDLNDFNFDGLYKVINNKGQAYYFRFGWVEYKNSKTIFSNVKWLNGSLPESGKYKILTVDLKLKQQGHISLCTIGDSQTWWNEANNLRLYLNNNFPDVYFVGSRTDINGYPHEGEGGNHSNQVLARINYIPKADYYSLLLGTNDWQGKIDSSFDNINRICNVLLTKSPKSKILYLTPLPTTNKIRDEFNIKLQGMLMNSFITNKRIMIIDIGNKMRENANWAQEYLLNDGLHQNQEGVKLMAEMIAGKIKSDRR
ncbi:MAG: hypothetical protein JWQ09_5563 [Segetibacter sp.]|nr:hypothetical protein [Segetibacter sp.]